MPADLNRSNDTAIATLKLMEITPKNWHRFPTPISKAMTDEVYVPTNTWNGGFSGDETSAETNVRVDDQGIGDYSPRNLTEYMALPGNAATAIHPGSAVQILAAPYPPQVLDADYTASTIVNSPRGWIDPNEPYGPAPVSPTDDPTITSLAPNTAVSGAGQSPVWVVITGTKFTPYSIVETGGVQTPYFNYISPTKMNMLQDAARSSPGIVVVKVIDHGVKSAGSNFTFT
jgi:hypothetical protein